MTEELLEIRKDLSKKLKKERMEHTVGVMYTAGSLAMCYHADLQKALTAVESATWPCHIPARFPAPPAPRNCA